MARKTLDKKNIIRKRLEISNGDIKRKTFNKLSNNKEKVAGEIKPSNPKKIMLSKGQKKRVNSEIENALRKTTKNKLSKIIGNGSRFDRSLVRSGVGVKKKKKHVPYYIEYPNYYKQLDVDFDVAICICSFNRYSKVNKILKKLFEQETKYTFKVFFMNDGSTLNKREYKKLKFDYPEIVYVENNVNGGKYNYWKTITKLWLNVEMYKTHALCQIDDDFDLCDNFLNLLMDKYFDKKQENNAYMAFRYHLGYFTDRKYIHSEDKQGVDGGTLYDIDLIKRIDYTIPKTNVLNDYDNAKVWDFITYRIRDYGMRVYFYKRSLAFHDGNEDSKLHPKIRKIRNIDSHSFIKDEKISKEDL